MAVADQLHALAALYPQEKDHRYPFYRKLGGDPRVGLDTEVRGKISYLCRESILDGPFVQSVARHCTD
jgi:hypothetical protein